MVLILKMLFALKSISEYHGNFSLPGITIYMAEVFTSLYFEQTIYFLVNACQLEKLKLVCYYFCDSHILCLSINAFTTLKFNIMLCCTYDIVLISISHSIFISFLIHLDIPAHSIWFSVSINEHPLNRLINYSLLFELTGFFQELRTIFSLVCA